jgi:nitrate/TMAO reductase-like tetraheme cytochrome c subunit
VTRKWNTFWLVWIAASSLFCFSVMTIAAVEGDYGKAGFNLALTLVNATAFAIIRDSAK